MKRILIPTDFSREGGIAISQAAFMARLAKADLYLLHVVELNAQTFSMYDNMVKMPSPAELRQLALSKLNEQAVALKKEFAITVKTLCTEGKVISQVINAIRENKIDLVMMGTHGAGGIDEYFIGSNAYKVVSACPCPVITVRNKVKKPSFSSIVLPVDNTSHSRQKVNAAIQLANLSAAKIHVLGLPGTHDKEELQKFKLKLDPIVALIEKAGLAYDVRIRKEADHVAEQALKFAKSVKADLIVVMADHESKLHGPLANVFGSQLVNHSTIPVMRIRPEEGRYEFISLAGATGA